MYAVNRLPKRNMADAPTGCCPRFNPAGWDGETFQFDDKLFMRVESRSFAYVPLNMSSVMKKAMQKISDAGAAPGDEYIMLSYEVSPWNAEHYISVAKEVPGAKMIRLSGTYLAKVFEGSFKEMGNWYKELLNFARERGIEPIRTFFSYTTCPACAKFYGKNYVVGLLQVKPGPAVHAAVAH